ncbi:sulfite oxidase-like oxidoreductase [Paracraurococcus ruber]|uniref:Sulfite oxidase-like oxidoreductase n=1 Tax=Paracraurococcus ruber TaxID=77675 RepID=A0ABS1D608_9PROT|nr:sulfite oxidase-like oxidoreductase [Paracraurococcus ruber]MBK1662325.1 sulfite oxidase-like oxidoreductase [Paracraurococcus ruber]TDG13076.1 sulfite oxidase-like oxidoreductase [Paracraurococcus ruber]
MAEPEDDVPVTGKVREKLVETKQAWAREGRLLTGESYPLGGTATRDRLPPGQTLVKDWPVLDLGVQPDVAPDRWRLRVEGLVQAPVRLTLDEFMALPQAELVNDIHCVTQWSRYDNRWQGVLARDLVALARPKEEARFVAFTSYDGYTTNVPLAEFTRDEVLLAHSWEGAPLTRQHGGPVRVVIPRLYFWKSPKWVTRIELLRDDRPGFWEVRGYHNNGDPWLEERYG